MPQQALTSYRLFWWTTTILISAAPSFFSTSASAQFDTVINLPPETPPRTIFEGTLLNVFNGGFLSSRTESPFRARGGEVNVYGGAVGAHYRGHGDSVLNVFGGTLGRFFTAYDSSTVNMYGGQTEGSFRLFDNGAAILHGGTVGSSVSTRADTSLTIVGGEFRVDGVRVDGLTTLGSSVALDLNTSSSLSGVLKDGTPFVLSREDGDNIADGTLTLQAALLPSVEQFEITVPRDAAPRGIRDGQLMIVGDGGVVGRWFAAGWGSSMHIQHGGYVGSNTEAIGTHVAMSGGEVDRYFRAFDGSKLDVSGGVVGDVFNAYRGSEVNISGGTVGEYFRAWDGSRVRISGGNIGALFSSYSGSKVEVLGGNFGERFRLLTGGEAEVSGGRFGDRIETKSGSQLKLIGSEFELDGAPVAGLLEKGDRTQVDLVSGLTLTGVLADGSPISINSNDGDAIRTGTLFLELVEPKPQDRNEFVVPNDVPPNGLRKGQILTLRNGGMLDDNFTALSSSQVRIEGGVIANNFEAVGASIELVSGEIGERFDAFSKTQVSITGGQLGDFSSASGVSSVRLIEGSIGDFFSLSGGSSIEVIGGIIGNYLSAQGGSTVDITGGSIGDSFIVGTQPTPRIVASDAESNSSATDTIAIANIFDGQVGSSSSIFANGIVNIYGGKIGDELTANYGGTINILGGEFGDRFNVRSGGEIHFFGTRFLLDGEPIDNLEIDADFILESRDITLSAFLMDGSMLEVELLSLQSQNSDYFSPDATIIITRLQPVPEPATILSLAFACCVTGVVHRRRIIRLR